MLYSFLLLMMIIIIMTMMMMMMMTANVYLVLSTYQEQL